MVKTIEEVLSPNEIWMLEKFEKNMQDVNQAKILENVLHIECSARRSEMIVRTYMSLKNPYNHLVPHHIKMGLKGPIRHEEEELIKKRRHHKEEFSGRRHEIVLDELRIRTNDILAHKWYLSEKMAKEYKEPLYDAGIVTASAHWLKDIAEDFYGKSKEHHYLAGMDFEWEGMEKAVVIAASNKKGKETYYVLVREGDLLLEENLAQWAGGVVNKDTQEVDVKKADYVRKKLIKMHITKHFYILS